MKEKEKSFQIEAATCTDAKNLCYSAAPRNKKENAERRERV